MSMLADDGPKMTRKGSFGSLTSKVKKGLRSSSRSNGLPAGFEGGADEGDKWETGSSGSVSSTSSLTSRISGAKAAMKRRLTAPLNGTIFGKNNKAEVHVGEFYETVLPAPLQAMEDMGSEVLSTLQVGTSLQVLQVGGNDRVEVMTLASQGWMHWRYKTGEMVLNKYNRDIDNAVEKFDVGGQHEILAEVTVRVCESLDSEAKAVLKPGAVITIMELGTINRRRAKVSARALKGLGVEGWISIASRQGEVLIGDCNEKSRAGSGVEFVPKFLKVKGLLEAAVSGDLTAMKRILEGNGGMVSRLMNADNTRPDINCCDVRGMTALMYASTFCNKAIVEYLMAKKDEIFVNALDNTHKSALHHASKRSKTRRGPQYDPLQASIVGLLVQGKAALEARDHNGCTALMFAVANGDHPVTQRLLAAQADVCVQDFEGRSPMDYATNFGHQKLAEMLREAGANGGDSDDGNNAAVQGETEVAPASRSAASVPNRAAASPKPAEPADTPTSDPRDHCRLPEVPQPEPSTMPDVKCGDDDDFATTEPVADERDPVKEEKRKSKKKDKEEKSDKKEEKSDKKKSKKDSKHRQSASAGMMEAIETNDQVNPNVTVAQAAVVEEDTVQEVDEKAVALAELKALMENNPSAGELKAAIKVAQERGAEEADLRDAEQLMKELKARAKAAEKLRQAAADREVSKLKKAIAEAEETKVAEDKIMEARAVLAEEEPKQKVREKLLSAKDSADVEKLKSAIAKAKKVGLRSDEVAPFEELLAGVESKEKAEAMLKAAFEKKEDIAGLRFAIQQAKDAGADAKLVKQANKVLKEEEPRHEARVRLADAVQAASPDALREALKAAGAAGLDASETKEATSLLRQLEEREQRLITVKAALEQSKTVDTSSIDAIRDAKDRLTVVINEALVSGVPEAELLDAETRRKKLHNAIEDLKGSIRVFCRVRPLSSKEREQGDHQILSAKDSMTLSVEGNTSFQFDAVFTPGTQAQVFEDCRDLVQSAADGYNVTIFAYGQTGAGKTYTMYGYPGEDAGTTPRTITELFQVVEAGKDRFNYTVMVSMLELYTDRLVDLLVKGDPKQSKVKLNVRTDKAGTVNVDNLIEEQVYTAEELTAVLDRGSANRTVAATAMNSESSRSHLVLLIKIVSVNKSTKEQLRGKILMCDLAGSERLKKSQVTEEMQKEAIEINKSLTALGDVIEGLTKGAKVIPYRNHKLTQLMQDSLGGSAKTLMFVNCSPANSNLDETINSLKYATRAKTITNTIKK